jgi:hypothetical protein
MLMFILSVLCFISSMCWPLRMKGALFSHAFEVRSFRSGTEFIHVSNGIHTMTWVVMTKVWKQKTISLRALWLCAKRGCAPVATAPDKSSSCHESSLDRKLFTLTLQHINMILQITSKIYVETILPYEHESVSL